MRKGLHDYAMQRAGKEIMTTTYSERVMRMTYSKYAEKTQECVCV